MDELKLTNVSLQLGAASGPVDVLKNVDFSAKAGESVAVVGPSGSGKSSLISVAAGLEKISSGEVVLLGESLSCKTENQLAELRRGKVSMVFQSFHLLPTMNAFDNVRVPLEIAKLDNVDERARQALDAVDLNNRIAHYPGQLSGGERQRVAVARALASHPKLVFADEPTGNLDSKSGTVIADLLFSLAKDYGATLILVTHDAKLARRASRIVTMNDGRLK